MSSRNVGMENIPSLLFDVNEEKGKYLVLENSGEGKHTPPAAAAALLFPCAPKVKSEQPERDSGDVEREASAARPGTAEDLKLQQQRSTDPHDGCKAQDVLHTLPNNDHVSNVCQKEELHNMELNSLGESSLVKLKRRIRLKLLAEEARNSIAKKVELCALQDEVPFPTTRIATRNATSQFSGKLQSFTKDEKPVTEPLSSNVRCRVVDLSSESEDEDKMSGTKFLDKHDLRTGSTYNNSLQNPLGPLLSDVDSKDSKLTDLSSTAAATAACAGPQKSSRPAKKASAHSELPLGRKITESVSSLVKMLKKGVVADDVSLKLRQTNCNKIQKDRKVAAAEDSALAYEQERADNIRRNKEFLAQLGLSSTLHSMAPKKSNRGRTPGSKNHAAGKELYENHHNIEEILLRNREILERRAAGFAFGSKRPKLLDIDLDNEDDHEEDDDVPELGGCGGGKRQKKNSQSSMRTSKEQNQQTSIGKMSKKTMYSKATCSSGERGKSSKEGDNIPRAGRRRSIPAVVINGLTASNQELIRFIHDLMASASFSLPQALLRAAGSNPDAADYHSDQSSPRNNLDFEVPQNDTLQHEDDSPRISGDPGRRRKDTWLTMIPFETPKTAYELERDEILRGHKDQFERLGIVSELIEDPQPPRSIRPYCRRWASEPDPAYQRNTRLKDRQRKSSMQADTAVLKGNIALAGTRSLLEVHSVSCASSLVARFTGGCKLDSGHCTLGGSNAKLEVTDQEVMGFQSERGTWLDPDLTRIYTMDLAPVSGSSRSKGLLAAGGSQGRLAVFAVTDDHPGSCSTGTPPPPSTVSKTPLLSWTVDSSWVSQVVFLSNQFQENGTLLLSSSNDGRLVLWDINKQRVRSGTRGLSPLTREGIPVVVCESSTLHNGGIFGMHESRGRIASSSEGSVAISTIKETGIVVERSITGHHAGVIRSVRFREQNILADCGVDTVIGILDLRASDPCTMRIQTKHKTGINMVEWSPVCWESNLVLSASNDPQLYLHDIRYPANAMLQFEGHVHPRRVKCYSIYRPAFVAGGDAVVTPGEGTHQLSLYSVTTGTVIRKLRIGYDPNILLWNSVIPKQGGVWAGCRGISKFQALWQQRGVN